MPIGQSWLITRSDRNFILGLGNRPAYSVLVDTFNGLTPEEQARSQNNLFIGLANNEYHEEFQAGDFLIRNLLGADPGSGVLAVGAYPRTGQTLQFHRRDAAAAGQELGRLLEGLRERLRGRTVHGGLMCLCLGRGARMFGRPDPDAALVQEQLGPLPMAGFFGNGEIGPVGDANFLHGYTAVLGLFVSRDADPG
jgi:small ligand-binding sensory domain FIST